MCVCDLFSTKHHTLSTHTRIISSGKRSTEQSTIVNFSQTHKTNTILYTLIDHETFPHHSVISHVSPKRINIIRSSRMKEVHMQLSVISAGGVAIRLILDDERRINLTNVGVLFQLVGFLYGELSSSMPP